MSTTDPQIKYVYKIDAERLASELETHMPHWRCVADEWGEIKVSNEVREIGRVVLPAADLHHEKICVQGDPEIANVTNSIVNGATRGAVVVYYVVDVPKGKKR